MGTLCFMCGLGGRDGVKLTTLNAFDNKGRAIVETVCDHCKEIALQQNHPQNQDIQVSPEIQGFIKPSNLNEPPSVRPN